MKLVFLYNHPHPVHGAWAEHANALFIQDRVVSRIKIPGISRLFKSLTTLKKIPKDTDAILCESSSQLIAGAIWKLFNRGKKLACIVSDPKVYFLKNSQSLFKKLQVWMFKKADLLIPTSPLMLSLIPEEVIARKVVVFPYVDVERYSKYSASLKEKTIIFTGRISYEKGADRAAKVFELTKSRHPEAKMYMLGFGDLQESVQSRNLPDLNLLGWTDNPEEYLKQGSIYLSMARIEPAGIAILEAMSMGLIPVVSIGVGNQYIVEKISRELIVSNEAQAATIIHKLWNNPGLMEKYSKKAKVIARRYNYQESIKQFRRAMQSIGVQEFQSFSKKIKKYKPSIKPY